MRFYLQDVSDGLDLNLAHTLATTTVNVVSERPTGLFEPGQRGGWAFLKTQL